MSFLIQGLLRMVDLIAVVVPGPDWSALEHALRVGGKKESPPAKEGPRAKNHPECRATTT